MTEFSFGQGNGMLCNCQLNYNQKSIPVWHACGYLWWSCCLLWCTCARNKPHVNLRLGSTLRNRLVSCWSWCLLRQQQPSQSRVKISKISKFVSESQRASIKISYVQSHNEIVLSVHWLLLHILPCRINMQQRDDSACNLTSQWPKDVFTPSSTPSSTPCKQALTVWLLESGTSSWTTKPAKQNKHSV